MLTPLRALLRPALRAVPAPLTLVRLINSSCSLFVCHFPLFLANPYLWQRGDIKVPASRMEAGREFLTRRA